MSVEDIQAQLEDVLSRLQVSENKLEVLTNLQAVGDERSFPNQDTTRYEDVTTNIATGDQIQLESYKSIPEFNGDKTLYQSWRNQVTRRMKMIDHLKSHPKYEAALGIIRAKITGSASDTLTNNQTAYNIEAIIERLDASYADQRPLYIIEAEMTSIKQYGKTLQEYHDAINQALNLLISKITLTYKTAEERKALTNQAQVKAIRTFIIGLKSRAMRNILYGGKYATLSQVYTSAQTVYYDDQYLQLDQSYDMSKPSRNQMPRVEQQPRMEQNQPKRFYSNAPVQNSPRYNLNLSCNQPQQKAFQSFNKAEPMDVDTSNKFKQNTTWRQSNQPNVPQKRGNDFSFRNASQPYQDRSRTIQDNNKIQRINQVADDELDSNEEQEGDVYEETPEDATSHVSYASVDASAFLSE